VDSIANTMSPLSLSCRHHFTAPTHHRSIPHRPHQHGSGSHSRPQARRRRILPGVMPSNILLNLVLVYAALTIEFDVDYTSKRC
jgi:hypothetical protein